MPRLTRLEDVTFPITLEPLYSDPFVARRNGLRPIPGRHAVVNHDTGQVLGIAGRGYRLITHIEAVELGRRCCRDLFGLGDSDRLEILGVDAPASGAHCYVDLVHPAHAMNLLGVAGPRGQGPEVYVPYVRVTNSYNGTRALRFDVGFCRRLCNNGVIFEHETIRFSYPHLRREADPRAIQFRIEAGRMQRLCERFKRFVAAASQAPMGEDDSRATVRRVLGIAGEEAIARQCDPRRRLQMLAILNTAYECLRRYRAELGPNAYAVFNAMTELARTLGSTPGVYRDAHALQRLAGGWLAGVGREGVEGRRAA